MRALWLLPADLPDLPVVGEEMDPAGRISLMTSPFKGEIR